MGEGGGGGSLPFPLFLSETPDTQATFSRSSFSRSRKRIPWSKFWLIKNRFVSYTPLESRSSCKQFQALSK